MMNHFHLCMNHFFRLLPAPEERGALQEKAGLWQRAQKVWPGLLRAALANVLLQEYTCLPPTECS